MKKLLTLSLALALTLGAIPANAAVAEKKSEYYASEARSASISATESISPGEVVRLSVSVSGYEDPVITYIVKKPGKSKYSYLKKNSTKTSVSYRLNTEGEYSFKAIVTERNGSNKKTTSAATSIVEVVEVIQANSSAAQLWDPRDEVPSAPASIHSARDGMDAINRTVLSFGETMSFPAFDLTSYFKYIDDFGGFHNAFLKGGSVSYSAKYDERTGDGTITIHLKYDSAGQLVRKYHYGAKTDGSASVEALEKWVNTRLDELLTSGMSDTEKVKAIHDFIVSEYEYDVYTNKTGSILGFADESFTAYGLVKNGYGVCEAYAELFCLMSTYAGIPCYPVTGTFDGGNHMWNKVKLNGEWSNIDCTTDDPIPNKAGRVLYTYYLKDDADYAESGYRWDRALWPAA